MVNFVATPKDGAVWITGGSTGIGKEVAIRLADEGFRVFISARSAETLNVVANEYRGKGSIVALQLDVSDREASQKAVERIISDTGGLAIAIFNAGTFVPTKGQDMDFNSFDKTMKINFEGTINGLLPSFNAMKEQGGGQIAIVSSVAGYGGLPKNATYGASKAALINMAESLKFDFDRSNVKLQLINPGFIDTPMTKKNDFPMPFLMPVDKAADRIISGLKSNAFEMTFPRRFTWILKTVNLLPYRLYFAVVAKMTGVKR